MHDTAFLPPASLRSRFSPGIDELSSSQGEGLAPSDAKPQAPPFSNPWALMSASWSPASLCPEPNELLQPTRTLPRVCRGPGLSQHTEPPFTPRPAHWARWWARGSRKAPRSGGGFDGLQSGHCWPPRLAGTTQRASVPWRPPGPLHGHCACPHWRQAISLGWGWGGGGGKDVFIHLAADSAKVGLAHVDL